MSGIDHQGQSGFSGDVLRLCIASALAVLLLAGGVYWLHNIPVGEPPAGSAAAVQVQLLVTEEPTPYPVAAVQPREAAKGIDPLETANPSVEPSAVQTAVISQDPTPSAQGQSDPPDPVRAPPSKAKASTSEIALKFQQALLRHIARFQRYPSQARQSGIHGTVRVLFLLRRDGTVLDAWVQTTSGQQLLDREAIETIMRSEPLPQIPSGLPDQMRVLLPIDFALQ